LEDYNVNVDDEGTIRWYQNDNLHRLDGPAIECLDGYNAWYFDGKLHRPDGPAINYADGSNAWYFDGKRHRLDGPAIVYTDGFMAWYISGKVCTKKEFDEIINQDTIELTLEEVSSLLGYKIKIIKH